jgi:hypothetical protein
LPTQVDWCPRCNLPVYDVDGLPDACSCVEGSLRALLATRAPTPARLAASLPDLPAEWFMSSETLQQAQAQKRQAAWAPQGPRVSQEMATLESLWGEAPEPEPATAPRRVSASQGVPTNISLESLWGTEGIPVEASGRDGGLEALWGTEGASGAAPSDGFDIQFGDSEDIDLGPERPARGSGGSGARYRVDRPPPPPQYPFVPRGVAAIVQDGEAVGGRGRSQRGMTISEVRAAARQAAVTVAPDPTPTRSYATPDPTPAFRDAPVRMPTLRDRLIGGSGPLDD